MHRYLLCLLAGLACADDHTREDRAALFDYLVAKTLEREAFSPPKNARLGLDFARQAEELRAEFLAADRDDALYCALLKLSNLRRDRHLRIDEIDGGIDARRSSFYAPIRFAPDFTDPDSVGFFVADRARGFPYLRRPELGDRLLAVGDVPVAEHAARIDPFLRYSTAAHGAWELAEALATTRLFYPAALRPAELKLTLQAADGSAYVLRLPWEEDPYRFEGVGARRFPGFRRIFRRGCYTLYLPEEGAGPVLLDWHRFERESLHADMADLMELAAARGLLDADVIVDLTHSRGGSLGADVLRRLSPRPFRTTFGNLRCSDVVAPFTAERRRRYGSEHPLVEWLEEDVAAALARGDAYAPAVPFKLAHLPRDSDGLMQPAEVCFRGRLVILVGPRGGSHLDQFAAMVIDNDAGHSIGMATGGYSNTWEWTEDVRFPTSGAPAVRFQWSIGHTLRPNGEVLEGNPAEPVEYIPLTAAAWPDYHDALLRRALAWLEEGQR